MTVLENLVQARKLISKPENWCQGSNARDKNGVAVALMGDDACNSA